VTFILKQFFIVKVTLILKLGLVYNSIYCVDLCERKHNPIRFADLANQHGLSIEMQSTW